MQGALELLVAIAVLAGSAPAVTAPAAYEIRRVATCREVAGGLPVEPTDTLRASEGKVLIWFQGEDAQADVEVRTEWYVNGIHEVAASHTIRVTRGSNTGVFTLQMPGGAALPVGAYRVDLVVGDRVAARHAFQVVPDASPPATAPALPRRQCKAGFSLPIPPGFHEIDSRGAALALQRDGDTRTGVVVVRQSEPARVRVERVLERARATMAARTTPRLVFYDRTVVDGRSGSIAVIEDRDGSRQKAYVIPRDEGATSRDYYVIVGSSPAELFSELEAALTLIAAGFRVEAVREAQAQLVFPVLFTAGAAPRPGELASPTARFAPDERTVHVRFRYEGGTPGQLLTGVWFRVEAGQAREFARSTVKLEKAADLGQFAFTPDEGRWPTGTYRVDIRVGDRTLRSVTFTVAAPGADI